ncbi:MAG: EboA domain-containing protein [Solirubrobacteraceae bacterium]|jgi:hypothetical protein
MIDRLHSSLLRRLGAPERAWLADALRRVRDDPSTIFVLFPAAGRGVGRGSLDGSDKPDEHALTVDDAARVLLLDAIGDAATVHVGPLYHHGDAAERRAVLRALAIVDVRACGVPLVEDALRTNDPRLIAAALGPYAFRRLPAAAIEHAVLKCVFMDIPLSGLDGLDDRVTPDLSRMLAAYAHERIAAGRSVPPEVWGVIDRHPPSHELTAIDKELRHDDPARRRAAQEALADRAAS